jgi:hypothetical protein
MAGVEAKDQTLSPSALNPAAITYTTTSTPPVALYLAEQYTGDSGTPTWTLDLTSFTDIEGVSQDATGKKVQEVRIQADADNSAIVVVEDGAANAYSLFGSGNDVNIPAGGLLHMRFSDELADVSSGAKNIKITLGHGDIVTVELAIG